MLDRPTILFGHPTYGLADAWRSRGEPIAAEILEERSIGAVETHVGRADVLVVSRLWHNDWIDRAERLVLIQSVSAGTEQFDLERLRRRGIRLASAQGANANAVAEHAWGLILSLSRRLRRAQDCQDERRWRGMLADTVEREVELAGATLVVVGLGQIGRRIAKVGKALDMRVIGIRRTEGSPDGSIDAVWSSERLHEALSVADVVVLACPHTPQTEGLIGTAAFAAMKSSAFLINVARGRVVDEDAMVEALRAGRIAAAGLDCFHEEPLPTSSPLWSFANVLITSHNAGDTQHYEPRVVGFLAENLARLSRGETQLCNQVV